MPSLPAWAMLRDARSEFVTLTGEGGEASKH
jgi:hypothetical protein